MRRCERGAAAARLALALAGALAVSPAATAQASPEAREALALCDRAEHVHGEERKALLARGLALAEQAVKGAEGDPTAHFAVFCNLGKQVRDAGVRFGTLRALLRMRRAVDRTLDLAPDHVGALVSKGALLTEAPGFAGGDIDAGARLLVRALELDPDNVEARRYLARAGRAGDPVGERAVLAVAR